MMEGSARRAAMQEALDTALHPSHLEIEDQSHLHRGHAGAKSGKGHFRIRVVAAAFDGCSLVARHRLIYTALASLMETDIHALSIEAQSPAEYDA